MASPESVRPGPVAPAVPLQAPQRDSMSPQRRAPAARISDSGCYLMSRGGELNVSFPLADQGDSLVRPLTAFSHVPHTLRDNEIIFQRGSGAHRRHPRGARASLLLLLCIFSTAARGPSPPSRCPRNQTPHYFLQGPVEANGL